MPAYLCIEFFVIQSTLLLTCPHEVCYTVAAGPMTSLRGVVANIKSLDLLHIIGSHRGYTPFDTGLTKMFTPRNNVHRANICRFDKFCRTWYNRARATDIYAYRNRNHVD